MALLYGWMDGLDGRVTCWWIFILRTRLDRIGIIYPTEWLPHPCLSSPFVGLPHADFIFHPISITRIYLRYRWDIFCLLLGFHFPLFFRTFCTLFWLSLEGTLDSSISALARHSLTSFWHMSALRLICINGRGNGPATVASDFWAI